MALHGTLSQPRLTMKVTRGAPLSQLAFRAARAAIGLADEPVDSNVDPEIKKELSRVASKHVVHSPLSLAIIACEQECVKILLDAGFDPVASKHHLSSYDTALLLYHDLNSKDPVSIVLGGRKGVHTLYAYDVRTHVLTQKSEK